MVFAGLALLQEHLAVEVEREQRDRPVQQPAAVRVEFLRFSDRLVILVDEDDQFAAGAHSAASANSQ